MLQIILKSPNSLLVRGFLSTFAAEINQTEYEEIIFDHRDADGNHLAGGILRTACENE
jgi:hypothetical protein